MSGDGLTMVLTATISIFPVLQVELHITTRAARDAPFTTPQPLTFSGWSEPSGQGAMSPSGSELYFYSGGRIMHSTNTGEFGSFSAPQEMNINFPANTMYPQYPRPAEGFLYYSIRELNQRRSLYAHEFATGESFPVLYDAGPIYIYAVSPNHRFIYVTFEVGVGALEVYRAQRSSTSQPFSALERVDTFLPDNFAVSSVTDDDCEVFGIMNTGGEWGIGHAVRQP